MIAYVMNTSFQDPKVVDVYESFIWTERFQSAGDFELYMKYSPDLPTKFPIGSYIRIDETKSVMVIEDHKRTSDPEDGLYFIVTGRSVASLLDRRVIWLPTTLSGSLQSQIKKVLDENLILASDPNRRISSFVFKNTTDPIVLAASLSEPVQLLGESLYKVVEDLCLEQDIGFRVELNSANKLEFELYGGVDRSFAQTDNPYVTFSPEYENLKSSNYVRTQRLTYNMAMVIGEGEGLNKRVVHTPMIVPLVPPIPPDPAGLDRRELKVESSATTNNGEIDTIMYGNMLAREGRGALLRSQGTEAFSGEVEDNGLYVHARDYFLGDIVQLVDEVGSSKSLRVVEITYSSDVEGRRIQPIFREY